MLQAVEEHGGICHVETIIEYVRLVRSILQLKPFINLKLYRSGLNCEGVTGRCTILAIVGRSYMQIYAAMAYFPYVNLPIKNHILTSTTEGRQRGILGH